MPPMRGSAQFLARNYLKMTRNDFPVDDNVLLLYILGRTGAIHHSFVIGLSSSAGTKYKTCTVQVLPQVKLILSTSF